MQISTRGRYAVMAMAELACRQRDGINPVTLGEIATGQQLSLCYLEQLFGGLRRRGLVVSARGPGGGYRLARPAADMTIRDILHAVEEPLRATRCGAAPTGCLHSDAAGAVRCRTHDLWEALGQHIQSFLGSVTLEDVVTGQFRGRAENPARVEPVV